MKVKKGDNILVISGKDKGKTSKVMKVLPKEEGILVEGTNLRAKHIKPRREGEQGQVVKVPAVLNASNVKVICPKCGKPTRVGYKIVNGKKFRICKKCQSEI